MKHFILAVVLAGVAWVKRTKHCKVNVGMSLIRKLAIVIIAFGSVSVAQADLITIGSVDYDSDGDGTADIFALSLIYDVNRH